METMGGMGMMGSGGRLTINGKNMNIHRIDEQMKLGATEIWELCLKINIGTLVEK